MGMGSIHDRTPPLEHHDKGSQTRLGLLYLSDSSAGRRKHLKLGGGQDTSKALLSLRERGIF